MSDLESRTKQPDRRINKLVILGFLSLILITLLGVVFIPWDVAEPKAPDLEFKPLELLPDANASTYIENASRLMVISLVSPDGKKRTLNDLAKYLDFDLNSWDEKFADEVLAANATVFPELEKAVACRHYACKPFPNLYLLQDWQREQCDLIHLLDVKSIHAQFAGDYAGALNTCLLQSQLGQLMAKDAASDIEWSFGNFYRHSAWRRMELLAADTQVPETILRKIMQALNSWDKQEYLDNFKHVLQAKYTQNKLELSQSLQDNSYWMSTENREACYLRRLPYAYKPNMTRNLLISYYRKEIADASQSSYQGNQVFPFKPRKPMTVFGKITLYACPNSLGKIMVAKASPMLKREAAIRYNLTYIDALRLKVALRLYELKYGELPNDLTTLVPEFIWEIPKDPYDGKLFRYSKINKNIWVVGADRQDNGGQPQANMIEAFFGADLVMPLSTRELKPNPAPATQPLKEEPKP
jgi:hypothetical protein